MAYLYILSLSDGTAYCGITKNIVRRLQQHQHGMSKSTRNKRPLVLKYLREFDSMNAARFCEVMIKKQGVSRWLYKNQFASHNLLAGKEKLV